MEKQEFQVGDLVYCLDEDYREYEDRVISVTLERDESITYVCDDGMEFFRDNVGYEVFKTKEDRKNYLIYGKIGDMGKMKAIDLYNILKEYTSKELESLNLVIESDRTLRGTLNGKSGYVDKIEEFPSHIRLVNYDKE